MGHETHAQASVDASLKSPQSRREPTEHADSIGAAAERYYWKPMMAASAALELQAFGRSGLRFGPLACDLGCGDGTFAGLLRKCGIVDHFSVGIEWAAESVEMAQRRGVFEQAVRADIRLLPLADESMNTLVANQSLEYLGSQEFARAVGEAHRVLRPGGYLVCTMPTMWFKRFLLVPKFLLRVGAIRLAARYRRWQRRRCGHRRALQARDWQEEITSAGFCIVYTAGYCGRRQVRWWELLSLPPFRILGLSKRLPWAWVRRVLARSMTWPLSGLVAADARDGHTAYVLIIAQRNSQHTILDQTDSL